jgi:tetratricopeptide (TPR) repeat protein
MGGTAERFALGASLGTRYEIQALLGQGGMGAVYKAHDRELERTVAIKVIRPEMAANPAVLERFKREIILASKVTHRNVLRIHDFGEAGDVKFISMNYVEGESLNVLLQREGPLPFERALPLVRQIGDALQAAHEAGVVHRDLKPQNILLDREGNAFIADFGISRSIESGGTITEAGSVIGTVDYMSPEQARGEKSDQRGDLYSFGVILYVILTGKLPFGGGDALSVMMKRLHEEPPPIRRLRPELPAWLSDVVSRAMRRDPADRYQSVAEMLHDLESRHAATSWRRIRRRVLIPAAAVVAVAALILGGVRYWKSRPTVPAGPVTSLIVLPFQNLTGDAHYDWVRDGLPSLFRDDLVQAKDLRLVGEDRLRETLETLRAPAGEESRPATMRKIATLLGADHVVAAKLLKTGSGFRIEATLQRAGSQDSSVPALVVDGAGDESIPKMLGELTSRVWDALGVSRGWIERARGAGKPVTASPEALAQHGRGVSLFNAGKYLEASVQLEQAVQTDPGFSMAQALLAETYDILGYSDKAQDAAKKAAAGLGNASPHEAARIQATMARVAGDLDAAEKAYAKLCEITPSDAEAFFNLASVRQQRGELEGAEEAYRRVIALDPKYPNARVALARLLTGLGNSTEAVQELDVALRLHEESGNDEGRALVLNGLGNVYLGKGDYGNALSRFQQSLEIRRRIGDKKGVNKCLVNIALVFSRQGRFDESIAAGQDAIAIAREIGERILLANTLSEIGDDYQVAAQPENAMKAYQESLKIFRERGVSEPAGEARALDNVGYANTLLGRSVEALYSLKDALAKRRLIGDKGEIIRSLSDIGDNERLQGGYEDALKYYTDGLALARANDDQANVMAFVGSLANIHEDQGNYGAALSLLAEGEKIAREAHDDGMLATILSFSGGVRRRVGDLVGADAALREASPLAQKTNNIRVQADLFTSRAALFLARGERGAAGTAAREALRVAKPVGEPWMLLRARIAAGEADRSVSDLNAVAKEAEAAGLIPIVAATHLALARVELAAGHNSEAVRYAEQAIATGSPLGLSDVLFQAHHAAAQALEKQRDRPRAVERYSAALEPLGDMRVGLQGESLRSFLGREDVAAFGSKAREAFLATNRAQDAERLQRLLQP